MGKNVVSTEKLLQMGVSTDSHFHGNDMDSDFHGNDMDSQSSELAVNWYGNDTRRN
jgi:hypothetical protein